MQNCYFAAWQYLECIASEKMRDMKASHWQRGIDSAVAAGKGRATCENIRLLASRLCQEAMKDDIISRNYSSLLTLPAEKKKVKCTFSDAEIAVLKEHDSEYEAQLILILIYSGMRIGELLNLRVSDVYDGYVIGGEKTEAGRNRIIPIIPSISSYIKDMMVGATESDCLVRLKGKPISITHYRRTLFYSYLVKIGILTEDEIKAGGKPHLTPHSTRHTFATLAVQSGMDKTAITRIIGHTEFETTDRHYVEMQAKFLCQEMRKIAPESA